MCRWRAKRSVWTGEKGFLCIALLKHMHTKSFKGWRKIDAVPITTFSDCPASQYKTLPRLGALKGPCSDLFRGNVRVQTFEDPSY